MLTAGKPVLIKDPGNPKEGIEKLLLISEKQKRPDSSAIILVDGISPGITPFLTSIYNQLADSVRFFGGGAGFISFENKPCVFNPEGCFRDCAIIAFLDTNGSIGVTFQPDLRMMIH